MCFQFLNNITRIFTHFFTLKYFQKNWKLLFKHTYQTNPNLCEILLFKWWFEDYINLIYSLVIVISNKGCPLLKAKHPADLHYKNIGLSPSVSGYNTITGNIPNLDPTLWQLEITHLFVQLISDIYRKTPSSFNCLLPLFHMHIIFSMAKIFQKSCP